MRRLVSLDAFRGATVAAMLLVNNPGSWSAVWRPLSHAEWHGWTPTDFIFPFFLFVVGITTELSKKDPRGIVRRGALIVLAGLLLNAFPFTPERFETLRISGVLQRIGIVYIAAAFVARWCEHSNPRTKTLRLALAVVVLLFGYWGVLSRGPLEPPDATIAATVDRAVLGPDHIWKGGKTWDPEGPLSTIPAIATALLGVAAAPLVVRRRLAPMTVAGVASIVLGWVWGLMFPINKNLWTSSYVVFTAGWALLVLAVFIWVIDVRGRKAWSRPFVIFGINPLIAFLGSGLMARLLGMIKIDGIALQALSYRLLFKPYFEPRLASFLWALSFVLVWLVILWIFAKMRWVVRV
jgi:predicted acyltransferase